MGEPTTTTFIGSIDQGTGSTRFLVFDTKTGKSIVSSQVEVSQTYPKEGWVEIDPVEILTSVQHCIKEAVEKLQNLGFAPSNIKAVGLTNQRETTILWDASTGKAITPAMVWLDQRTAGLAKELIGKTETQSANHFRSKCGLPINSYFSALKMRWALDNIPAAKACVSAGTCKAGTVDSWLLWNLLANQPHLTDVTNASRTMLMNIKSCSWDPDLCQFFQIPQEILPTIKSSAEIFGTIASGPLKGIPIAGCLGDQQAALLGQGCIKAGQAKNTYGTGCFLLCNSGFEPVFSNHGLLTTVAYKLGKEAQVVYAMEGSVAIAGALVKWLRDNMGLIQDSSDLDRIVEPLSSSHGVYLVPAFSGLYAPHWNPDARGILCGLTQFTQKAHIVRAALDSVAFQTKDIIDAIEADSGQTMMELKVDGGMTVNKSLMQIQADILSIPVQKPKFHEATALGAALAAGIATEIWSVNFVETLTQNCVEIETFQSRISDEERDKLLVYWQRAIERSKDWLI